MARPAKLGIDYVPWDADWDLDPRVIKLAMEHGITAKFIYHLLVNYGAKDKGYYLSNDENTLIAFCNLHGQDLAKTLRVVESSCLMGLFDASLAREHGILTSKRWQETYMEATKRRTLPESHFRFMYTETLLAYTETPVPVTETTEKHTEMRQKKRKEINNPLTPCPETLPDSPGNEPVNPEFIRELREDLRKRLTEKGVLHAEVTS